jgi:hypothetical protein
MLVAGEGTEGRDLGTWRMEAANRRRPHRDRRECTRRARGTAETRECAGCTRENTPPLGGTGEQATKKMDV